MSVVARPTQAQSTPAAEAARTHFDRWASAYGRSRLLPSLQRKALAELQPGPGDRLLDVACGAGALVAETAPQVERAVGLDLSEGMLRLARNRLTPGGPPSAEFVHGPSDALPFEDRSFTAVVCTTALHHFPDPQASMNEMARVLAPGGRLVIGDICRDTLTVKVADPLFRRFEAGHVGLRTTAEIEGMLTDAGLRVMSSRRIWARLYTFIGAERPGS